MVEDFGSYADPGIYVEEIPSPVIGTAGIAPTVIGLVGDTRRFATYSEVTQLLDAGVVLSQEGVNAATLSVTDRFTGQGYVEGTDWAYDPATNTLTHITGGPGDGTWVTVSYEYTGEDFYDLQRFNDYDDVRDLYGNPFDPTGAINSPLSLAAYLAFSNGASRIVCAAVEPPTAAQEVQHVYNDATAGTFTLTWDGFTTAAIAYNATATTVQTELNALTSITDAGGVTVTGLGNDTDPWIVTWNEAGDRSLLVADSTGLTATVGTTIEQAVQGVSGALSATEFNTAIDKLRDDGTINVVVPVTGDTAVHDYVARHVDTMFTLDSYRRAFVGMDVAATRQNLIDQADTINNPRVSIVGPTSMKFYEGRSGNIIDLGSFYAAVAVAASHASRPVQEPLTRKPVRGFHGTGEKPTEVQMIEAQRAGVLWLWEKRQGGIVVRHGVTTDMTNVYTREVSIQAAKDRLMTLVHDQLDVQGLIGSAMVENTPDYVMGAVAGALEFANENGLIFDYSGLKYRVPNNNPTMIQVRFMYKPTLPLNYVRVQFAIDTNTGTTQFSDEFVAT